MVTKLSKTQVDSWRLSNHHLLHRAPKEQLSNIVSEVCGVQAQVLSSAELGLWARVDGIKEQDVQDALWKTHSLVKTWCMRGTLHLLAASDLPLYVSALKTRPEFKDKDWLQSLEMSLDDLDEITLAIRDVLDERCLSREELARGVANHIRLTSKVREAMLSGWGVLLQPAAFQGYLCFGPSQGQKVTFVRPDKWIPGWRDVELTGEEALQVLLQRFMRAYGPITHKDFEHWWGRSGLPLASAQPILDSIRDELAKVDVEGHIAWMLRSDFEEIENAEVDPAVRLLPSWDSYVMFYSPRERFVHSSLRSKIFNQLQGNQPVLLMDGVPAGVWQRRKGKYTIEISIEPFSPLSPNQKRQVEEEATSLGEFFESSAKVSFAK